ncbi:hypothetical protein X797_011931 [Metarhizium robertsii]|uniref:Uncharacterized protein n=1 Tax=Metarhizium robertsii TaxID=568076 RepID=A0A014N5N5_9HYPO|nr:hypothetical protein X797_011931 [Metarhizium robertsii]
MACRWANDWQLLPGNDDWHFLPGNDDWQFLPGNDDWQFLPGNDDWQFLPGNDDFESELGEISSAVACRGGGRGKVPEGTAAEPENSERTEDGVMPETPEDSTGSHRPKRMRAYIFNNTNETELGSPRSAAPARPSTPPTTASKPNCQRLHGAKGVLLGTWRDSDVPSHDKKHAVIGFIDTRDHLRIRIQPNTKCGESLTEHYPLPPGPGRCWVSFGRVIFSDHLVGLDQLQVKEYTRIRSNAVPEKTEGERVAAEYTAVQEAIHRAKTARPPAIAHGATTPEHPQDLVHPELKRRKGIGGSAVTNPAPTKTAPQSAAVPAPQQSTAVHQAQFSVNPLPGKRPAHVLIGCWRLSSEIGPKNWPAVYGTVHQDGKFCVNGVRETGDGRFVDGNFPSGRGALWIPVGSSRQVNDLSSVFRWCELACCK